MSEPVASVSTPERSPTDTTMTDAVPVVDGEETLPKEEEQGTAAESLAEALASRPVVEFEEEEVGGDAAAAAAAASPYLMHRFSTWKTKATAVTASWRKTVVEKPLFSSTLMTRVSVGTAAAVPLQQASLSPSKSPRRENDHHHDNDDDDAKETVVPAPPEEESSPRSTASPPRSPKRDHSLRKYSSGSYASEEYDDDDRHSEASSYVSSSFTNYTDESRTTTSRVSALQWAAAGLVESRAGSYFRGRYAAGQTGDATSTTTTTPCTNTPASPASSLLPSQTARILQSPQAVYMQELMDSLESHQYMMLLGRGMLGVNLKQTFLKHHGVYVDFLVLGGAADRSGVILTGDVLVSVGPTLVSKTGTILTVPALIASAPRPVHLVLSTTGEFKANRLTFVDVSIAMMHLLVVHARAAAAAEQNTNSSSLTQVDRTPKRSNRASPDEKKQDDSALLEQQEPALTKEPSSDKEETGSLEAETGRDEEEEEDMQLVTPTSFDEMDQERPVISIPITCQHTVDSYINPGAPSLAVQEAYASHATQRNNDGKYSVDELVQTATDAPSFRAALQKALLTCVVDTRRFFFLSRHLAKQDSRRRQAVSSHADEEDDDAPAQALSSNAMLLLLLEMITFCDLYHVTPTSRRREIAQRLASKYFLPVTVGKTWVPPVFDFHSMVPDTVLRELEATLADPSTDIPRQVFVEFLRAVVESLADRPFLSFIVSNECARMRAYLRNTAPVVHLPLRTIFERQSSHAKNTCLYMILHLLCLTERQGIGENDDIGDQANGGPPSPLTDKGPRMEDAASGLCAALWVKSTLKNASAPDQGSVASLEFVYERLWAVFLAPGVGALSFGSYSNESQELLQDMRRLLEDLRQHKATADPEEWKRRLLEPALLTKAEALADELVYDYAVNQYTKFRGHKLHEWLSDELSKTTTETNDQDDTPALPAGSIKRLLRKLDFPVGLTPHKPSRIRTDAAPASKANESLGRANAECAVVFGSAAGLVTDTPVAEHADIRRYACQTVSPDLADDPFVLTPDQVPTSLEGYAVIPPSPTKPFGSYSADGAWRSDDGWEVSLFNFCIPRAEASGDDPEQDASMYGVSLLFQRNMDKESSLSSLKSVATTKVKQVDELPQSGEAAISFSDDQTSRELQVSTELPQFGSHLAKESWTSRLAQLGGEKATVTLGVALVSRRNVILAMRETLTLMLRAFAKTPSGEGRGCQALVDVVGNFAHPDVETQSLRVVLEPFLRAAASPWIERPIGSQKEAFEQLAGQQLVRSLPPIPLALLFVTALLEQKIVLSSSRRSVLFSATTALSALLKPLQWCHLMVPRVPSNLAADLLQYPAPFILGMASEDEGIMDLIRDLPVDVTLVDLDVGRVILAPSFAHDSELGRGQNADTAQALRSQVLYLAQSLGSVFGACLDPVSWSCDMPLAESTRTEKPFESLKTVCHDFLTELLAGTTSCCYWIQEATEDGALTKLEPTILFDEDRFFRIKNVRDQHGFVPLFDTSPQGAPRALSLALDDFDLVLELFLRCQAMNDYIGTRDKQHMAFC